MISETGLSSREPSASARAITGPSLSEPTHSRASITGICDTL